MKSILDSSFKYTPSLKTDVRKTFDRIRREREEQGSARAPRPAAELSVSRNGS